MKKPIMGVLLGALVLFAWGALSWMLLPFHESTIQRLPEEQLISDTLKTVVTEPGLYLFPSNMGADGQVDDKAWAEKYKLGPIGTLAFRPAGDTPMSGSIFLRGFAMDIMVSTLGLLVLFVARDRVKTAVPRSLFMLMVGLMVGISGHLGYWNWFHFPLGFVLVNIFDSMASFFLMGLVQSRFVPEA